MKKIRKRHDIYFHVETIGMSELGTPIHAYHLSGLQGVTNLTFLSTEGLFPDPEEERALKFPLKKYIFILGRTLASDSHSNFFVEGFLNSVFEKDRSALEFLNEFVIVVVPIVNVDGANLGHTFADENGENIESQFKNPVKKKSL